MKKFLAMLTFITLVASCAKAELSDEKIYLFYSEHCGYCHVAMDYINQAHPKLEVEMVDVQKGNGYNLMIECAGKHNLGNRIGTPLFCVGTEYMMGWGKSSEKRFDDLVSKMQQ